MINPQSFIDEKFELYSVPAFPLNEPEHLLGSDIKSSKQIVAKGDVLLCKINPKINRVWSVRQHSSKYRQIASSEWIVIRQPLIDTDFLMYQLSEKSFREKLCANVSGVGGSLTRIQPIKVATYAIKIPPPAEQKEIAICLGKLIGQIKSLRVHLNAISNILEKFRKSVLSDAISGKLTEKWRGTEELIGWKYKEINEIADIIDPNPSHRYPEDDENGVPILSTQQFLGISDWTLKKSKTVSKSFFEERKDKCGFEEKDIVFARKGRLGLPRFIPTGFDFVFSHTVFIVRTKKGISNDFLLWSLRPEKVVAWLSEEMSSNSGIPTLRKNIFEKLPILLPPISEQVEVVRRIEELFTFSNQIEHYIQTAQSKIDQLGQVTLSKAFRGELTEEWRDINSDLIVEENSAEALLEKIKFTKKSISQDNSVKISNVRKKKSSSMKQQEIVSIAEALKNANKSLSGQELFIAAGYPSDATTEQLEQFFLDIREQLDKTILRYRPDGSTQDWFELIKPSSES